MGLNDCRGEIVSTKGRERQQKGTHNVMAKGKEPWREKKIERTMLKGRKRW
jgi:hypothetical protein